MSDNNSTLSVAAVVISAVSLIIGFVKDFLIGAKIQVDINSIISLRLVALNRNELLIDILTADLRSKNPSQDALIISREIGIHGLERSKIDRNVVGVSLMKCGKQINYVPTDDQVRGFFGECVFKYCFAIPIVISNIGKKSGSISKVIAILTNSIGERWAYTALLEMDAKKLLPTGQVTSDSDRIKNFFNGLCVPSNSRESLMLFMVPIDDIEGRVINKRSPGAGVYSISVTGFDQRCEPCFSKIVSKHVISEKILLDSFRGSDSTNDFHTEKCIGVALKITQS